MDDASSSELSEDEDAGVCERCTRAVEPSVDSEIVRECTACAIHLCTRCDDSASSEMWVCEACDPSPLLIATSKCDECEYVCGDEPCRGCRRMRRERRCERKALIGSTGGGWVASIMVGEDRVRAEARAREREAAEAARYAAVLKAEEATRQAAVLLNDAVLGEDERRPWWAAASREQRELGLAREAIVKALAGPAKTKPALDRPARSLASLPSEVCTLILRFNPMNVRGEEQRNGIVSSCRHFHRAATASFQDRRQHLYFATGHIGPEYNDPTKGLPFLTNALREMCYPRGPLPEVACQACTFKHHASNCDMCSTPRPVRAVALKSLSISSPHWGECNNVDNPDTHLPVVTAAASSLRRNLSQVASTLEVLSLDGIATFAPTTANSGTGERVSWSLINSVLASPVSAIFPNLRELKLHDPQKIYRHNRQSRSGCGMTNRDAACHFAVCDNTFFTIMLPHRCPNLEVISLSTDCCFAQNVFWDVGNMAVVRKGCLAVRLQQASVGEDQLRPMLRGMTKLAHLSSLSLKHASFNPISSLELSLFLKHKPNLENLEIVQQETAHDNLHLRSKILPKNRLSRLKKLVLKRVVSLQALQNIVAAAPMLVELNVTSVKRKADEPAVVAQNAWAGVCETLATTARGTLRSVELDDRWFPDSSLGASSCAALARIEGLVKGPVVADPPRGAHFGIPQLPNLRILDLSYCKTLLTKLAISNIALLPRLVRFETPDQLKGQQRHPGAALAALKSRSLEVLIMNKVKFTSRQMRAILSNASLTELHLSECDGSGASDAGLYAAGLYEDAKRKIELSTHDCKDITDKITWNLLDHLLPFKHDDCDIEDESMLCCDICCDGEYAIINPVWPSTTEMIVCCNTCSIIYCGDCMDPENDDPIKHTWRECDGCGPQARGMPRDEFKRVTGESWAHCYGCLRTYWGAADEPLLCAGCHDQLEAGGSVWAEGRLYGHGHATY